MPPRIFNNWPKLQILGIFIARNERCGEFHILLVYEGCVLDPYGDVVVDVDVDVGR